MAGQLAAALNDDYACFTRTTPTEQHSSLQDYSQTSVKPWPGNEANMLPQFARLQVP